MDGLHHVLENGIEQLARLFWVALREEPHGALEVAEQHGHLLPLALERTVGRADLLGEVPGSVGLRESETGRPWSGGKGRTAAIAELASGLDLGTTARTDSTQCRLTFSAESCPFSVLRLAPGTLHAAGPAIGKAGRVCRAVRVGQS